MADSATDGLLLVGHGTRSPAGQAEMAELARLVADAVPATAVELGWLELSDPPAGTSLDRLVERGAGRIAVLPLMLHAGGHAKSDVPALVLEARERHPAVSLAYGRPLGVDHALLELGRRRVDAAGGSGLPLAVLSRGTSDPDANAEAGKVARLLAEMTGTRLVEAGFSGLTWPTVPGALERLQRLGAERVVALAWYLATGVLLERVMEDLAAFADRSGVEVVFAGHLGPAPELVTVVLDRHREALGAAVRMNCDVCAYRKPFPGLEDRVAQPLGVGHSHLALSHRHSH